MKVTNFLQHEFPFDRSSMPSARQPPVVSPLNLINCFMFCLLPGRLPPVLPATVKTVSWLTASCSACYMESCFLFCLLLARLLPVLSASWLTASCSACFLFGLLPVLPASRSACFPFCLLPVLPASCSACFLFCLFPVLPASCSACFLFCLLPFVVCCCLSVCFATRWLGLLPDRQLPGRSVLQASRGADPPDSRGRSGWTQLQCTACCPA